MCGCVGGGVWVCGCVQVLSSVAFPFAFPFALPAAFALLSPFAFAFAFLFRTGDGEGLRLEFTVWFRTLFGGGHCKASAQRLGTACKPEWLGNVGEDCEDAQCMCVW